MLHHSVAALQAVPEVGQIVIALPADQLDAAPPGTLGVAGGAVRSESVKRALSAAEPDEAVLVPDAARPLATPALFAGTLRALHESGADAVIAAVPVTDTIKQVSDGAQVRATLDRSRLWAVQTPQVFRRPALEAALDGDLAAATDDAWLIEQAGGTVRVFASDAGNLKVTTAIDLRLAEFLLEARER
jgi:2-C-methyl-D-erythritol 4-phosphate cytidylyltransferase